MRHYLARGGPRRPAACHGKRHAAGAVLHRAVREAGGGDWPECRLPPLWWRDRRQNSRSHGAAAPDRRDRRGLSAGLRADHARAGPRPIPDHGGRRHRRGHLAARRRQGESHGPDRGAGPRCPRPGRADPRAGPGDRHPHASRRRYRGSYRPGRHRGRDSRQLRRPVGQAGRRDVRGNGAAAFRRALLRGDRADRRGAPGPAGTARPGRLHLLQGRSRRAGRRRIRAGGQAMGRP